MLFLDGSYRLVDQMSEKTILGVSVVKQRKQIQLETMRLRVGPLASLSGLRIQHWCELWCRSQMRLGSHVAVCDCGVGQ